MIEIEINQMKSLPGPKYNPQDRTFYNMRGLHKRNFSFGNRMEFHSKSNTPGPIYNIPGFADKFENSKIKIKVKRSTK